MIPNLAHKNLRRPRKNKILSSCVIIHPKTYVFQCPLCTKSFRKKRYSLKLNPHKDKYGNKCFGRLGLLIRILNSNF